MASSGPADTPTPAATPSRPRRGRAADTAPPAPEPAVPGSAAAAAAESVTPAQSVTPGAPAAAAESVTPAEPAAVRAAPADPVPAAGRPEHPANGRRSFTVDLPLLTATVRAPSLPQLPSLPRIGRREVVETAGAVRSLLPPPGKVLFYGGLAALAALEIIEWPVAAVVAAGTLVAERSRGTERDRVFVPARTEEPATV